MLDALATRSTADPAERALLERGLLLHTDIALLLPAPAWPFGVQRAAGFLEKEARRWTFSVRDGRVSGAGGQNVHWAFARALARLLMRDGPGREAARDWYVVTTRVMVSHLMLAEAEPQLDRAREAFPAEGPILAESGYLHEAVAGGWAQAAIAESGRASGAANPSKQLREAADYFDRALSIEDTSVDTRLHLGRVLGRLDRHQEASAELRRVVACTNDESRLYWAWLFLGDEEQALGRFAAARECYERAASLFPSAQSPLLALSRLARRQGDRGEAHRGIDRLLQLPMGGEPRVDPWWQYELMGRAAAEQRLAAWRTHFN